MCQKFPSFVRWKRQCKQNVQIEIPEETLQRLQHSAGGLSDCDTFFSSLPVPLKHTLGRTLRSFEDFQTFFLQTDRFRVDFFVTLNLTTFLSIIFLLFLLPQIYQLSISSFFCCFLRN